MNVVVTVGMGRFPFDRLLRAVVPLCLEHDVFAQTGTSRVVLPCEHADYITYPELLKRLETADVVVTHAGNTVRLVQRLGKIPIAVARRADLGEMANDHQVEYLGIDGVQDFRQVFLPDLRIQSLVRAPEPTGEGTLLASNCDTLI